MAAGFLHWTDHAAAVSELRWKKFPVTSDGFVCLVDVMGDDRSVVQAARTSYGRDCRSDRTERTLTAEQIEKRDKADRGLIRRLRRDMHTTPFEMCELKFLVRCPMDCWRQWIRHRMASVNEYSTRYSEAIDSRQTTKPEEWRLQSGVNKQGSSGLLKDQPAKAGSYPVADGPCVRYKPHPSGGAIASFLSNAEYQLHQRSHEVYEERLRNGVAREQARKDLPLSTYTEAYWKIDLHNLFHFLSLRMDSHAQKEIRDYATVIGQEIVSKLFPVCWEAFEDFDFRRGGMMLSAPEIKLINDLIGLHRQPSASAFSLDTNPEVMSKYLETDSEKSAFLEKLRRMGAVTVSGSTVDASGKNQ